MNEETIAFFENIEFPQKPHRDENIFDTGIHNMFENPFTEILAFIFNSNTPYNGRNEFIKYFVLALTENENISDSFYKELNVETQITTKEGNFIDIIIYNGEYVITLENKIGHIPLNPFDDYESEINIRYNSQKKIYYLFSLNECENIDRWDNKLIGNVFSIIKNKLRFKYNNKWDYFVEDFLDHYIKEEKIMTKKGFAWCEEKFSKLMEGRDWLEEFIDEIKNQLTQKIKPKNIKRQSWDGSVALILKPFENDDSYIALCLDYDNLFSINIYYDDQSGKNIPELINTVGNKYSQGKEGKHICFYLKRNYYFNKLINVYDEIKTQWDKMKKIYK